MGTLLEGHGATFGFGWERWSQKPKAIVQIRRTVAENRKE